MQHTVLVIDDDRSVVHLVQHALQKLGVRVISAPSAEAGLRLVQEEKPDVVLLDIMLPRMSGMEVFQHIRGFDRRLPVIFITAEAGSETAIAAIQKGAYDYVAKPLHVVELATVVASALETRRLMNVPIALAVLDNTQTGDGSDLFIGRSPRMLDVFKDIGRVARQSVTVLIRGESGTGKELVARALYQFSDRANRPFMAVNCAALTDTLLESELFGHEKGAFTSADRRRIGKFEQCHGGTLFLDEVGDMSPVVQGKVLRALQEQKFERVGGNETIETDVRLIAATNRPLEEMVADGRFRGDLFYRLNVVTIQLPPLRERANDIQLLLQHYLSKVCQELDKREIEGVSPEAVELLTNYGWPGNIRELQSVIRQTVLKTSSPVIVPDFLPPLVRGQLPRVSQAEPSPPTSISVNPQEVTENGFRHEQFSIDLDSLLPEFDVKQFIEGELAKGSDNLYAKSLEYLERYLLTRVLQAAQGNQSKAASILGITRGKVRDRIAAFRITLGKNVTIEASE